ncbi:hypothetical protein QBC37DRAFT_434001 [Rhypophila decipiens]|uniref:Uncharacterized protein n=1 Tax=Rhypophila decipiens TaxID=261697 RepID=A0AAN6XV25_9PEZI|nr:hypothetical protein QBC37DRAFT_434001 [Rhypophila decipiens]
MKARYELRRYNELPKHEQYDKEGDAADLISKLVESITETVKEYHSFQTKFNAVEAIRNIFEEVIHTEGKVAKALRKWKMDSDWGSQLTEICEMFTRDDWSKMAVAKASDGTLYLDFFGKTAREAKKRGLDGDLRLYDALEILRTKPWVEGEYDKEGLEDSDNAGEEESNSKEESSSEAKSSSEDESDWEENERDHRREWERILKDEGV